MDTKNSPIGKDNNFTLIRYTLAFWLLLGHFSALVNEAVSTSGIHYYHDHFRVYAFFVISGFLVAASIDRRKDYKNFYLRRFFRIYPFYFCMITIQAAIMLFLLKDFTPYLSSTIYYLFTNLTFANFLSYSVGDVFSHLPNPGINPSLWTLKIEIGFYLILPLLWLLVKKYGIYFMVAVFVASTIYTIMLMDSHETLSRQLPGQLRYFIVGIAFYFYKDKIQWSWKVSLPVIICLLFLFRLTEYNIIILLYPLIVGTLIFLLAMRMPAFPIRYDISYGVFLIHAPILQLGNHFGLIEYNAISFIISVAVIISLAIAASILIERPSLKLGKHVSKKLGWQVSKN